MVCFSPSLGAGTVLHTGNFKKKVTGLLRSYERSKGNRVEGLSDE